MAIQRTVTATIYHENDDGTETPIEVQGYWSGHTCGLVDIRAADGSDLHADDANRAEQALIAAWERGA